jgi:hypothetical protein
MASDMVTIPRSEYERLKRAAAAKSPFLAELDAALKSGLTEPWTEVQRKR